MCGRITGLHAGRWKSGRQDVVACCSGFYAPRRHCRLPAQVLHVCNSVQNTSCVSIPTDFKAATHNPKYSTEIISDEAGNAPPIEPIEFGGMI